jgi:Helicase associated domain
MAWLEQYERLKIFYQKHGHSNVPQRYPEDPRLGSWLGRQRSSRYVEHMTEERRQLLNEVEFCWELQSERFDRLWDESYTKLEEFKAKHGHCNVPQLYDREKRRSLGMWTSMQRTQYHRGTLSQDRQRKLEELGFLFEKHHEWGEDRDVRKQELMWRKKYAKLVDFYETYGHTLVPNLFVNGRAESLGRWVRAQRSSYLQKFLPESRRKQLERIGFIWIVLARGHGVHSDRVKWNSMYSRLVAYRMSHGDCLVPGDYSRDKELARWVEEQRSRLKLGSVSPGRIERLDAIGFLMTKEKYEQYWNRQFKSLVMYQRKHGTTVVGHTTAGRLLRWTAAQRYLFRNKLMTEEHEKRLESIGFDMGSQVPCCARARARARSSSKLSREDRAMSSEDEWSSDEDDDSVLGNSDSEESNDTVQSVGKKLGSKSNIGTEPDAAADDCSPCKRRRASSCAFGRSTQVQSSSTVEMDGFSLSDARRQTSHSTIAERISEKASICYVVDNANGLDRQLSTVGDAGRCMLTSDGRDAPVPSGGCAHAEQEMRHPKASDGLYSVCDLIYDGDDARERDDCAVLYPIGTRVRKYFHGYGWILGEIALFEGVYRVRYEDGDEEDFISDDKELEEILRQAQSKHQSTTQGSCLIDSIVPIGTRVYKHFPSYGWFSGEIVAFDGLYLVRHEDGDEEELFYDSPEIATIVARARDGD